MFPQGVLVKQKSKMKDDNYSVFFYYKGKLRQVTIEGPSDIMEAVYNRDIILAAILLKSGYEFAEFEDYALYETDIPNQDMTFIKFLVSKG